MNQTKTFLLNWILVVLIINTILISTENFNFIKEKYEYKVEFITDQFYLIELNKLGREGWKIVGSRRASSSDEFGYELILMKSK